MAKNLMGVVKRCIERYGVMVKNTINIFLSLGILVSLWVLFFEADYQVELDASSDIQSKIALFLMLLGPWFLLILLYVINFNLLGILIVTALMFASELFVYFTAFIAPGSSTSALIYAVKPVYQILLIIPAGLLTGKAITFWKNK